MSQADREQRAGAALVALADTSVEDYDVLDQLDQLVGHCVTLLAADAAGLLWGETRGELRPVAASDEDARTMEFLQVQAGEGPCWEAWHTADQVRAPDLTQMTERWPTFGGAVARAGVFASVHAIPLRLRGQVIGALNLFHRAPGALPEADLALAQALADIATIGILRQRAIHRGQVRNEHLQATLDSRVIIEQAKGIVSQRLGVGVGVALDLLRRRAHDSDQPLTELARRVVGGELDPAVVAEPV